MQGMLDFFDDPAHHPNRLEGEVTVSGLATKHDHGTPIQNCVCHVQGFGSRGEWLVLHGGQHLSCRHDDLAGLIRLLDHHLLGHPHLLHGDLHAEIAAGHHDAVGLRKDLLEVLQALDVLDLGDDLDVFASEVLAAVLHIISTLNEAEGDVVRIVGDCPVFDVLDLTLSHDGDVHLHAWNIHVLLLTQLAVVDHLAEHLVVLGLRDLQNDGAVLDEDALAWLHTLGQLLVGDCDHVLVALEAVVSDKLEILASFQLLLGIVDLEGAGADLRAAGVHQDLHLALELGSELVSLLQVGQLHALLLVVSVGHVASDDVHSCLHQLHENLGIPGLWSDGADDVGLFLLVVHVRDLLVGCRVLQRVLLEGLH
mmetsp:Transcript_6779/g.14645  ORF Transcript_6779/g.14645 Transcript_6779/m.14645 type:complete len:367 (+) Transcript_6779:183-1283(+)